MPVLRIFSGRAAGPLPRAPAYILPCMLRFFIYPRLVEHTLNPTGREIPPAGGTLDPDPHFWDRFLVLNLSCNLSSNELILVLQIRFDKASDVFLPPVYPEVPFT